MDRGGQARWLQVIFMLHQKNEEKSATHVSLCRLWRLSTGFGGRAVSTIAFFLTGSIGMCCYVEKDS